MALKWESVLDPDELLDFVLDWAALLDPDADTIDTSAWTLPQDAIDDGMTISSQSKTTKTTTVWLQGGVSGKTYELLNRITTAGGRERDQTVKLKVKAK